MQSSLGIKYPTNRDNPLHTADLWLEGKRADEGAEGLWRIHDDLYDLTDFVTSHPGGADWLRLTKGTDITEAFETHHINQLAVERLLPKFHRRKATTPRNYPFTFHDDGFYKTLKRRIASEIPKISDRYVIQSELYADSLFLSYITTALIATYTGSFLIGVLSGVVLSYNSIAAHNFFHKRDNFRMYYFDFTMMSSREWRISHALSHHLYTNTIHDLEISAVEPWFYWLPFEKPFISKYGSWFYAPVIYIFIFYGHWVKTLISNLLLHKRVPLRTFLPFTILLLQQAVCGQSFLFCSLMFLWIIASASLHFSIVGVNAAHHHPDLFHDGDAPRPNDIDFGVYQLDAVADRKDINWSSFLVITHFGDHALHHLFPTIDHGKLKFLYPTFLETCQEFGVDWKCTTQLDLAKGQYLQLARNINKNVPKKLSIDKTN